MTNLTGTTAMRRGPKVLASVLVVAVVMAVLSRVTYAAFSATASSPNNNLSAGSVTIGDNDAGVAMLALASAAPGDSDTGCIRVTYTGSLDAGVRLYATVSGSLGPFLTLTVTRGSDPTPSFDSCTTFVPDGTDYVGSGAGVVYSGPLSAYPTTHAAGLGDPDDCSGFLGSVLYQGTLAEFAAAHRDVGSGLSAFSTSGPTGAKSFRFSFGLRDDPAAQGRTAAATFTWETQPSSAGPGPATPPQATPPTTVAAPTKDASPLGQATPEPAVPAPSTEVPAGPGLPPTETGQPLRPSAGPSSGPEPGSSSQGPGGPSPERGLSAPPRPLRAVPASPGGKPADQSTLRTLRRLAVAACREDRLPDRSPGDRHRLPRHPGPD